MTTRPAKVSNVTTRSQTRTTNFLTTPDPIGFYLENADKRNLRLVSKGFDRHLLPPYACRCCPCRTPWFPDYLLSMATVSV